MTENPTASRPFYLITAASGFRVGQCLIACGADRHELPPVRGTLRLRRFASRADAVNTYPDWEEEIMTS